jgi:hypothetical protein
LILAALPEHHHMFHELSRNPFLISESLDVHPDALASAGELEFDDLSHPELDDVLDDLGAIVHKTGGEVVVVPTERMPSGTGIAAIYRY